MSEDHYRSKHQVQVQLNQLGFGYCLHVECNLQMQLSATTAERSWLLSHHYLVVTIHNGCSLRIHLFGSYYNFAYYLDLNIIFTLRNYFDGNRLIIGEFSIVQDMVWIVFVNELELKQRLDSSWFAGLH